MRREMSLQEIHDVQIKIMCKIHKFCKDNNFRYSLGGGTLLGAVRHKGFIPWDDDIDIMIPRPDYEAFLSAFDGQYENLIVQSYYTDDTYPLSWARIYDNRTVLISPYAVDGVFIDVFPIDGLPNKNETVLYRKQLKKIKKYIWKSTKYYKPNTERKNRKWLRIKFIIKSLIYPKREAVVQMFEKLYNTYPFETSDYAGAIVGMYGMKEHMVASVFREYIELPFEGHHFSCIKNYDAYLTQHYGDYMQLPPKEKQITHHQFKIYWKS